MVADPGAVRAGRAGRRGETWRSLLVGFIKARPALLRNLPNDVVRQGRTWPSPRTWDQAYRLAAAATASGAWEEVRSLVVAGVVGDGAATEFLRYARDTDRPDPEALLMAPWSLELPDRPDLLLASLASVTTAVAMDNTEARWNGARRCLRAPAQRRRRDGGHRAACPAAAPLTACASREGVRWTTATDLRPGRAPHTTTGRTAIGLSTPADLGWFRASSSGPSSGLRARPSRSISLAPCLSPDSIVVALQGRSAPVD